MDDRADRVDRLLDRDDVAACLLRYTRGVDRHDSELMESAFTPNAHLDYAAFVGGPAELARWLNEVHEQFYRAHLHYSTNFTIEIDHDIAHAESYFFACLWRKDESGADVASGRYVDQLERTPDGWRIARRLTVLEWSASLDPAALPAVIPPRARWDASDPSYVSWRSQTRDAMAASRGGKPSA
jgi:hypothetical protein